MARILLVSHTSEDGGGANQSLFKLLKYLSEVHAVAVVAPSNGSLFASLVKMGVRSYGMPGGLTAHRIPELYRLITRERFDLVYGNNFSSGSRNALIAAKLAGRPFVWHIREMLLNPRWRTAFFLRYADAVVAVSHACARLVVPWAQSQRVHVIHNGIDLSEFRLDREEARRNVHGTLGIPNDEFVVTGVGTICSRKGQEYTVDVASEVVKKYPATFPLLGNLTVDPLYVEKINDKARSLLPAGTVRLLGSRSDVPAFLGGSDVFLHTAVSDPYPRAVLEAMGAGVAVVAFAVDGISEMVVDGETGFLYEVGDVHAMSDGVKRLLGDDALRRRMGEGGRKRIERMSLTAKQTASEVRALVSLLGV